MPMLASMLVPILATEKEQYNFSTSRSAYLSHADIFKPIRSTILLHEPSIAVCESPRHTASAFRRVGAVEEGDMLVANIAKPA
jgi:hypothetical protein